MKTNPIRWFSAALVALAFAMTAAVYGRLPEHVPVHWDAGGHVNGFAPKPWGPFLLPLVMAGTYALLSLVPRISPRGYRVDRFEGVFAILTAAILAFLFYATALALSAGLGAPVPMSRAIVAGVGVLLAVLGNFMGKLTRNFFVGIRTPWTLASDEAWFRTHRLAGKLFVLAGLGVFVSGLLDGGAVPILVAVAIAGGIPVLYSYLLYRKLEET